MSRKKQLQTLLMIIFVAVTGVLFCCDRSEEAEDRLQFGQKNDAVIFESEAGETGGADGTGGFGEDNVQTKAESETAAENQPIYVYVCGQVEKPAVYELPPDCRLFEAIEAAGGALQTADLNGLNLAAVLQDGEKIYVPAEGETVIIAENTEDKTSDGRININTATVEQLQTLPGIGEAKAKAIIAYRETNGSFSSVEDLRQVPGIKDGVFGQIQALIRVD